MAPVEGLCRADSRVKAAPVHIPGALDISRIDIMPLAVGTAAQIVRLLGDYCMQVNEAVPRGSRAAAIVHLMETHPRGCFTAHCEQARIWLVQPPSVIQAATIA